MVSLLGEDSEATDNKVDTKFFNCNSDDHFKQIRDDLVVDCKLKIKYLKAPCLAHQIFMGLMMPMVSYLAGAFTGIVWASKKCMVILAKRK